LVGDLSANLFFYVGDGLCSLITYSSLILALLLMISFGKVAVSNVDDYTYKFSKLSSSFNFALLIYITFIMIFSSQTVSVYGYCMMPALDTATFNSFSKAE
jgi:hypothetical protein